MTIHRHWKGLILAALPIILGLPLWMTIQRRNQVINTPLFIGELRRGNMGISRVEYWLSKNADVNGRDDDTYPVLSLALWEKPQVGSGPLSGDVL